MTYLRLSLRYVLATISIIVLSFALFFIIKGVLAWTNPSQAPPGGSGAITVSGSNVGIGTTSPTAILQINPANGVQTLFDVKTAGVGGFTVQEISTTGQPFMQYTFNNGNVGIGTTSPGYKLDVASGGGTTARFGTAAGDTIVVGGGSGKITTGTVDPLYSIEGLKYATYLPGMTGQKEETTGVLTLSQNKLCGSIGSYCAVLDFNKAETGSDVWLFYQITDFGNNWQNLVVLLTPTSDEKVWYKKEPENHRLLIFGNKGGEVSYRFTAPRFDWQKWSNVSHEPYDGLTVPYKRR